MPTIPKAERKVERTALRGVQQQGASREAFGGGIGKSITQAGDVIGKIQLDALAEQNEARAKELDVEFSQSLRAMQFDPQQGYYNKRGKDAFDYQPLFTQATQELTTQFLEKADNDSQRMMLSKVMQQRVTRAQDGVARHAFKEYNAWIDGASVARADDAMQEAIVNYSNPKYVKQLRQSGRSEIINVGQRQGKDQEAINNDLKEYDSNIHLGTIDTLIQQDIKAARAYFDENKDEIDGRKLAGVMRKLKVAEKGDLATSREDYSTLTKMSMLNQNEFINVDLAEYELSDADFKKFENQQVSLYRNRAKSDEKNSDLRRAMTLSRNSLKNAGINVTPKAGTKQAKKLSQYEGQLFIDINKFVATNKRAPNKVEMYEIIDNLLTTTDIPGAGKFGFFSKESFKFENEIVDFDEIPEEMVDRIRSDYAKDYKKYVPTESEIRQSYTNKLFKNAKGSK